MRRIAIIGSLSLFALLPVAAGAAWVWQANAASQGDVLWDRVSQFGVPFMILVAIGWAIRAVWMWFTSTAWPQMKQSIDNGFKGLSEELKLHRIDQASQHAEQLSALRELFGEVRLIGKGEGR